MDKYLVLTTPNSFDVTAAVVVPRCITDNPKKALSVAREACTDECSRFVSQVIIFKIKEEEVYTLQNYIGEKISENIVFIAECNFSKSFKESFFGSFMEITID